MSSIFRISGANHIENHMLHSLRLDQATETAGCLFQSRKQTRYRTRSAPPETLEGQIVRKSDQIAYINHDIDDAMRAGILTNDDIPRPIAHVLGETHKDRINTLVTNTISHTIRTGELSMDPEVAGAMRELRSFMFQRVQSQGHCTAAVCVLHPPSPGHAGYLPTPAHL